MNELTPENTGYSCEVEPDKQQRLFRPAGFGIRFLAYAIDLLVIIALANLFITFDILSLNKITPDLTWLGLGLSVGGIIASVYFLVMTGLWSQTIGKMITGIKVIRTDGQRLNFSTLLFRELIGRFISQLGGFHPGYLWVILHPRKQGWHDQISDTFVIHENGKLYGEFIKTD